MLMKKHFVTFFSPGTFVAESTTKPIDSWDVDAAKRMAASIKERYGAIPYGFRFETRERGDEDLDSRISSISNMYYLGGVIRTKEEILAGNDPEERILRSNVECNDYKRIIENNNSWRITRPLDDDDVVLSWTP